MITASFTALALLLILAASNIAKAFPLIHTFNDPSVTRFDHFGRSVAIDGNLALVGASHDDIDGFITGQAHLFDVTTGDLLHTVTGQSTLADAFFDSSVSMDGS